MIPADPELFKRTAPRWNCVDYPGDGLHYLAADGRCRWCGTRPPAPSSPRTVVVSSAEVFAQGSTLLPSYWVFRQPGETWEGYRLRRRIEDMEQRARSHDQAAANLRAQIRDLRGGPSDD